jgi:hypothetical protein
MNVNHITLLMAIVKFTVIASVTSAHSETDNFIAILITIFGLSEISSPTFEP